MWIDIETGIIYREHAGAWRLYGYLSFSSCWPRPDFENPSIPDVEVECDDDDVCEYAWPPGTDGGNI